MPRFSRRQKTLKDVQDKLVLNIALQSSSGDDFSSDSDKDSLFELLISNSDSDRDLLSSNDSDVGADFMEMEGNPDDLLELYAVMDSTQYHADRHVTAKSKEFALQYFDQLAPRNFRQLTRMDKASFFALVALIDDHPIFQCESNYQQVAVEWQLAVTLDRLGHEGNGACLNHMIPTWGVSHGSLCNFTSRCFTALEVALKDHLRWPGRAERKTIAEEFSKKGFPGCVGLIDGTLMPLSQRPKESGECYWDRKCRYSINTQVVCDHKRNFLFLYTGMPGSCADMTCFKRSSLCKMQNAGNLFGRAQYLFGDSGYEGREQHMVSAYRMSDRSKDREEFNMCVAKCRVTNEHCIGVLKSRWYSLREMRIQLKGKKDVHHLVRWIIMCARLHNYVIQCNDLWTEDDQEIVLDYEADSDEDDRSSRPRIDNSQPQPADRILQTTIMQYALEFHRQSGGLLNP